MKSNQQAPVLETPTGSAGDHVLRRQGLNFDCARGLCTYQDRTVVLARREVRIMRVLMLRAGEAVSDHELALAYTGNGEATLHANVTSCIQRLHYKIETVAGRRLIRRVYRYGFQID